MIKTSFRFLLCMLSAVILCSCSGSLKISASKVDRAALEKYKTYAWIAPGDTTLNTRRDDKKYAGFIENSANKVLQSKGMKIDNQNPDVVFMFDTHIDETVEYRQRASNSNAGFGFGGYSYGYNGGGGYYYSGSANPMAGLESSHIIVEEGTLSYSMYDRKASKLIWRGSAVKTLNAKTNIEATIKKATGFIFAKLPIRHKE
jgi:hypothetical protein